MSTAAAPPPASTSEALAMLTSAMTYLAAADGYGEDADYSPRASLIQKTRVTKGAATGHAAWVPRARAHPRIMAALADGEMSESYARTLCLWTGKLPEQCRDT